MGAKEWILSPPFLLLVCGFHFFFVTLRPVMQMRMGIGRHAVSGFWQGSSLRIRGLQFLQVLCLCCIVGLWGCSDKLPPQLQGYTPLEGRTYCKLVELGDTVRTVQVGDYITVYLRYSTWNDSAFFSGGRRFQLEHASYPGSIEACLARLSSGDSASFYLDAYSFFTQGLATTLPEYLDSGALMRVDVRVLEVVDSASFAHEKEAFLHWIEDFGEYERVVLRQYLAKEHIVPHASDSLYYLPMRAGSGPYPKDGDTLTLEFEGRFLDGHYFDSTRKRGEPFQFVLGQRWQVIDGLERAARLMREGEHAVFILPSGVAFGAQGSSTGIVPPYTSVVFDVELKEIRPGGEGESRQ